MLGEALQPEIHELLEAKDFATLKEALRELAEADVAELLAELDAADQAVAFRLLPRDMATEVFSLLPLDAQESLIHNLSDGSVVAIINEMPPDDRTVLLEELPGELAKRLLNALRGDELSVARALLNYPVDSVGRLMTPEYVSIRPEWTVEEVIDHIRRVAPQKETVNHVYTVDARGKLLDHISLSDIVLAPAGQRVADIAGDGGTPSLEATWDRETAVELFKKYDADTLPVVNTQGVLVGIVTVDDVLDVQEEESTEDFQMLAGVAALEDPYFQTGFVDMLRKRLPALVTLFLAEILTVLALNAFERHLGAEILVMFIFIPLINASAGNAGSQMAGLIIRGLAVQEMDVGDWLAVCWRELRLGATIGLTLALLAAGLGVVFMLQGRPSQLPFVLSLAMFVAVLVANLAGAMLPFALKRLKLDPAVTSAPLIASVMDVLSVMIYFGTTILALHLTRAAAG